MVVVALYVYLASLEASLVVPLGGNGEEEKYWYI